MKATDYGLTAILGALAALAIVGVASSVLERLHPVSVVLVDPPVASSPPANDLDLNGGE